jgi:hypothetical protein
MPTRKISRQNRFSRSHYYKYKQNGGSVFTNNHFNKIVSIGYEFECGDLMVTHLGLPPADSGNPRSDELHFLIPKSIYAEHLLHDTNCKTVGNYTCILSTETDTPLSGANETHSKMYKFEQEYLKEENEGVDVNDNNVFILLDKSRYDTYSSSFGSVFITHTEILFTVFDKKNSCEDVTHGQIMHSLNDEKCILNTMKTMIDVLHDFFTPANIFVPDDYVVPVTEDKQIPESKLTNTSEHFDMKLSFFKPNPLWIKKPIYYAVPTLGDSRTIDIFKDTFWVPQMTYGVKVEDIVSVTSQLSSLLEGDDLIHITNSMEILDMLMAPAYQDSKKASPKTKKKSAAKASASPKPTAEFKHVREIIKNVLFFAVYYFYIYYFYSDVLDLPISSIKDPLLGKNAFCFTLRHSIYEILNYYMEKFPKEMRKLNDYLKTNIIPDDKNITNVRFQKQNLISYVSRSFARIFEEDYVYKRENHKYGFSSQESNRCDEDLKIQPTDNYIFSKILKCQSNYFNFDTENETVLIEYRCFHKNLIQSYNFKFPTTSTSSDVHKSLDEWKKIVNKLHGLRQGSRK